METWIISDGMREYVEYFNPTGLVMVFTGNRDKAMVTTDSEDAFKIARIAREVYGRKHMRMAMGR